MSSGDLVCYCFGHRRQEIEAEAVLGRSRILESIETALRDGDCRCKTTNPSGSCCLKEVRALVARVPKEGARR